MTETAVDDSVVSFDAEAALAAARDAVGERVRTCVAYSASDIAVVDVDPTLVEALYGDEATMYEQFETVHDYVNVDFAEQDLFEDLFPAAGGVRSLTTHMDHAILVRILVGTREGLFIALDPGTDVTALVDAVESALEP